MRCLALASIVCILLLEHCLTARSFPWDACVGPGEVLEIPRAVVSGRAKQEEAEGSDLGVVCEFERGLCVPVRFVGLTEVEVALR